MTVDRTYTPDGQLATLTALQKTASEDQTTTYVHGTDTSDVSLPVQRSDLLVAEIHSGSVDADDCTRYRYDRQGGLIGRADPNGTVHAYTYDRRGRRLSDEVTAFGTGIDQQVAKITTEYNVRGQVSLITSWDSDGDKVNQIKRSYNNLGQLIAEAQATSGEVLTDTPTVGYDYDLTAANSEYTHGLRPSALTYPNGRKIHFSHDGAGGIDSALHRITSLHDDNGQGGTGDPLVTYQYLGLGTFVESHLNEPNLSLSYDLQGNNDYSGWDRFGRVLTHRWEDMASTSSSSSGSGAGTGSPANDIVHLQYGYDVSGNRTSRLDAVLAGQGQSYDEHYVYDQVNRLSSAERGDLDATSSGIIPATRTLAQAWSLDSLGNWESFTHDQPGTASDFTQTREHSLANAINTISNWQNPVHDRAGNMTALPKPTDPTAVLNVTYDAWNRVIQAGSVFYQYDGRNHRIEKFDGSATTRYYYSHSWQVLEERVGTTTMAATVKRQYV